MEKINFGKQLTKKHDTYNDGFIYFGKIKTLRNSKKEKTGETVEIEGKRTFERMYIRDIDINIADANGYSIDQKIKIPKSDLPENIKIKINNEEDLYDVKRRDGDNNNIYLYLQKTNGGIVNE